MTLDGAGANSIAPFFQKVFYDYEQLHSKVTVNYSPAGSSVGIKDIQENTVDFGDSEIPMSASAQAAATVGTVLQVPVELGGVAISYNVPGAPKGLHLDGPTLASIFDGTITNWDNPAIAKVSGVSNLPNLPIVPVHRADSSGPGWDLDQYLISTSPSWVAKIGTSKASTSWPLPDVGEGEQLNTGVATFIKSHTRRDRLRLVRICLQGRVRQRRARRTRPASYVAAVVLHDRPGRGPGRPPERQPTSRSSTNPARRPTRWPTSAGRCFTRSRPNAAKGTALGKLFYYVVTAGQQQAKSLGYSPLPANVAQLAKTTLAELRSSSGTALFKP